MLDRMEAVLRRMHAMHNGIAGGLPSMDIYAEASAIVDLLPELVDPDIQMARDVAADAHDQKTAIPDYLTFMRSGAYDDEPVVIAALAGIKRGRELASA
jgi:hypothetical protein